MLNFFNANNLRPGNKDILSINLMAGGIRTCFSNHGKRREEIHRFALNDNTDSSEWQEKEWIPAPTSRDRFFAGMTNERRKRRLYRISVGIDAQIFERDSFGFFFRFIFS